MKPARIQRVKQIDLHVTKAGRKLSEKKRLLTAGLALFFGVFGAHRFYVGKTPSAIVQLLTLGGLGVWATIDLVIILCGEFTDGEGLKIQEWS